MEFEVKKNQNNKQKYIVIPKESSLKEGDKVNINLTFGGVYSKEALEKYYEENKKRLIDIHKKLQDNYNKYFKSSEWDFFSKELPKIFGLGKMERYYEEPIFFSESDYMYDCYGDIDGGAIGDIYNLYSLKRQLEHKNDNKFNKEFKELAYVKFMKQLEEGISDEYQRNMDSILKEYGFEPSDKGDEMNLNYYDNKVHLSFFQYHISSMTIKDYHMEEEITIVDE